MFDFVSGVAKTSQEVVLNLSHDCLDSETPTERVPVSNGVSSSSGYLTDTARIYVATSGGTESILMSVKTHRDWARKTKGITNPEM